MQQCGGPVPMPIASRLPGELERDRSCGSILSISHLQNHQNEVIRLLLNLDAGGELRWMRAPRENQKQNRNQQRFQADFLLTMSKTGIAASCAAAAKTTAATSDLP